MDRLIQQHSTIMDKYDKQKRIALVVDEWGNWFDVEPGTNPGFLYQQNSLRDALTAGMTLNIFNNHADRVKMANIAQTVNVLQAIILTNEQGIVLTPTYHVFDLYQPHMDAKLLPYFLESPDYLYEEDAQQALSVSCSRSQDGTVNMTLVNIDPHHTVSLTCDINGFDGKQVSGSVITSNKMTDHNTFENSETVRMQEFKNMKISKGKLNAELPPKSVVLIQAW